MADERIQRKILKAIGEEGIVHVRPKIVSATTRQPIEALQNALRLRLRSDTRASIVVPHYWALYVHDGRRAPVRPRRGSFLIWFKNPKEDPRLNSGVTPERASQLRRLTPSEFKRVLRQWHEDRGAGRPTRVIITRQVNKSTPGVFFFLNSHGMRGFREKANATGLAIFRKEALGKLRRQLGIKGAIPDTPTTFPLRKESVTVRLFAAGP